MPRLQKQWPRRGPPAEDLSDGEPLSELRKDPITRRWVIIDTGRAKWPQDFPRARLKPAEEMCQLCPGNEGKTPSEILAFRRDDTERNTPGWSIRVVPNRSPLLRIEDSLDRRTDGVFDKMNGVGANELIIETSDHLATLSELNEGNVTDVIWTYRDRILDLAKDGRFRYVLISKSHGSGLWHAHSQVYALPVVPILVREELEGSASYFRRDGRCIFCDIVKRELLERSRLVIHESGMVVLAPYASRFPFETWILPEQHAAHFEKESKETYEGLGRSLRDILVRIDHVLRKPPYDLVLHTSPVSEDHDRSYHWHFELIPRLAGERASFETGSGFYVNPTPPEDAARFLKAPATAHVTVESTSWDLFVSHASEDKDDFVRPLVHKLRERGLEVWYDELTLKLGQSLRESIERGLKHSRYGLVVLSRAFFSKEWPRRELDGLATREIGGRQVILPVWYNVTFEEVRGYSPILADRFAASSSQGMDTIVAKVLEVVG